ILHQRCRRLKVDRSPCHLAEPLSQWEERRRRVWVRLAERRGVNAGDVEVAKETDHVAAHERHVHVAGSRPFVVEWLTGFELVSGDGAAAQNHLDAIGYP